MDPLSTHGFVIPCIGRLERTGLPSYADLTVIQDYTISKNHGYLISPLISQKSLLGSCQVHVVDKSFPKF